MSRDVERDDDWPIESTERSILSAGDRFAEPTFSIMEISQVNKNKALSQNETKLFLPRIENNFLNLKPFGNPNKLF